MGFETPPKQLSHTQESVTLANNPNKRKSSKEHLVTAAVVGALAVSDAQAFDVLGESQAGPAVTINYEMAPHVTPPLQLDENGRASLPAEIRQVQAASLDTPDEVEHNVSAQEQKPGRSVLFSDYKSGKVPSADPDVVNEQYREKIRGLQQKSIVDFRTEGEKRIDARVSDTEKAIRFQEGVSWTREQVRGLLSRITELTGADPNGSIQQAGDLLVAGSVAFVDAVLADRLRGLAVRSLKDANTLASDQIGGAAIVRGAAENASLDFDQSPKNARNMIFQHTLGGKSGGWEVTFGAGSGRGISEIVKGKLDPAVGVVFRLKLP